MFNIKKVVKITKATKILFVIFKRIIKLLQE